MTSAAPTASIGRRLTPILSLGKQPLANNLVPLDRADTPDAVFPLELMWCDDLKLVQLSTSVPPTELFSEYLYLTSFSTALVEAARVHVDERVARHGLVAGDLAMEIGSNDGYLLKHYQAHGLDVLGVDPASNVAAVANDAGVPTLNTFFGREVGSELRAEHRRPKVVHANNVMAHVPDVDGVMAGIAMMLHDDGVFVTETPYVVKMIDTAEFDTIYHEHLYYYSLTSYTGLLARNGLETIDVELIPAHGGSLRITAALPGRYPLSEAACQMLTDEEAAGVNTAEYYAEFGDNVRALLRKLADLLDSLAADGCTIGGYGAAAKATVLLNALGPAAAHVMWVADKSTFKQGHLMPGPRMPIVSPDSVLDDQPDYLLVLAWNYFDEIAKQLSEYRGAGGQFILPIPDPKVVA